MQEWDPEHFTNFAQLCEVSLATIREKTDAERLYLWLKAPEPQLYSFQLDQGLTTLDLAHLGQLTLPHHLIDKAMEKGQLVIEQLHHRRIPAKMWSPPSRSYAPVSLSSVT